ncbi:DNA polymerase I [Wenyingzhuangia marina]|uniref:DNA polymerase I n=1 Tax=Wenyingzhuangia marina TaxID=1195760 RepID=A0A1M5UHA8_9FLAO|nr:DNA polymerase I [Wenyingzhuangia marina]GGF67638.1 DNA polymerase I [Wenyingzhuangia marina]SHH62321.1 DNA polymerase I [Wenyingzhuangia marina]
MATQKRLFLLDAFALIFRGYYALIKNPRINSKGMDTSAILGFTNSLLDVIKREKPELLAVAFDKGGSVTRTEAFEAYKANRQETPEAIKIAVPYIHEILKAMNIPIIEVEGFEADDLIGTLAKQAEKEGCQVYMVTPDKDYAQLVSENIFMYRPARMGNGIEIWDVEKVKVKFEVETPLQVIDYLGMMGDAVDNIPGLPGVGDKTAKKFIKEYGSMENLLANTHELKGKMKEKIEANKELGLLSKELATIILDCPVEYHEENFTMCAPNIEETSKIFQELEFRRIADTVHKIFGTEAPEITVENPTQEAQKTNSKEPQLDLFGNADTTQNTSSSFGFNTISNTKPIYQYLNTHVARKLFISKLLNQPKVAFEIVTERENFIDKIIGFSFSYEASTGYYIPVTENTDQIMTELKAFFENENIEKIAYDIKSNIKFLAQYDISLKGKIFDISLSHYLLHPDMRHQLDVLSETYLKYEVTHQDNVIGKGKNKIKLAEVYLSITTPYSCEQSDICFQLETQFRKELGENNLEKLYDEIELPLLRVLAKMELTGINLDVPYLNELSEVLTTDIAVLEKEIYTLAGEEFNIASPKQLGIVLFENLKLVDKAKKTKTGQYATGEDILSKLATEHEIAAKILKYRGLVKLKNTYVDSLPNEVNPITKRVHTTYSQATAATGRLSSNNPNLQNIPIRTERGKQIRKAFIKKNEDYILFAADYSQIELRLIAELSQDPEMLASFQKGDDIHRSTAAKVFNVPIDEVTREQRSHAKTVNFGIIYGVSAFGLSQQTNLSRKESKELIDTYYETYPTLKKYMASQVDFAKEHGYVKTLLDRRRYLNNINSANAIVRSADERNAVNAPIQGTAADIIKIAMIKIQKALEKGNYKTKMLLQVHDELVFDMHKDEIDLLKPLIVSEMENAYKLSVPLVVDTDMGDNWLDAH